MDLLFINETQIHTLKLGCSITVLPLTRKRDSQQTLITKKRQIRLNVGHCFNLKFG